jgi:hypothetical protein
VGAAVLSQHGYFSNNEGWEALKEFQSEIVVSIGMGSKRSFVVIWL